MANPGFLLKCENFLPLLSYVRVNVIFLVLDLEHFSDFVLTICLNDESKEKLALSEIVVLSHRLNTITWESPVYISIFTSNSSSSLLNFKND